MADEPTLGEVGRSLRDFRDDTRQDLADLGRRIDNKLSQDVYNSDQAGLRTWVAAEIAKVTTAVVDGLSRHADEIKTIKDASDKSRSFRVQVYLLVAGAMLAALLPLLISLFRAALTASGNG